MSNNKMNVPDKDKCNRKGKTYTCRNVHRVYISVLVRGRVCRERERERERERLGYFRNANPSSNLMTRIHFEDPLQ